MTDTLVHAYLPLLLWTGVGLISFRFIPDEVPRLLGRGLYWVGVPLEIGVLARQAEIEQQVGWVPIVTIGVLLAGLGLGWLGLQAVRWLTDRQFSPVFSNKPMIPEPCEASAPSGSFVPADLPASALLHAAQPEERTWVGRSRQGSFVLASMIGNTGFVGLAIAPTLVDEQYLSWVVFYSVVHNVVGTYGMGVYVASYFGRSESSQRGWVQLQDVLTVPSLWAFVVGYASRPFILDPRAESLLHASIWLVIPTALLLMGMRLSQIRGWQSLRLALVPMVIKVLILPLAVGIGAIALGIGAEPRLALVLMSGMPTAFAGLVLAEEYDLDRELISSSIILTTGMLLLTIPIWLVAFGAKTILLSL